MVGMNVRILFFALYRDWAGTDELVLTLPAGATAGAAVTAARDGLPGLAALPDRPVVALNSVYSALDAPLRDGDELALLPPVAGG
jgi:molybdopterin converting factor small subunit